MKAQLLTTCHAHHGYTVFCIYATDDRRQFVVKWDRDSNGGFDLSTDVMARNEELSSRVTCAISLGEADENPDTELYLCIRDAFNSNDCKELTDSIAD